MLVLSRKSQEGIVINGNVKVVVLEIRGNQVRLGFEAPAEVSIQRREVSRKKMPRHLLGGEALAMAEPVSQS